MALVVTIVLVVPLHKESVPFNSIQALCTASLAKHVVGKTDSGSSNETTFMKFLGGALMLCVRVVDAEYNPATPLALRWTDSLPTMPARDDGQEAPAMLFEALRQRRNATSSAEHSTIRVTTSDPEKASDQYLMCLLGSEQAGVVSQLRHLVECATAAASLRRVMMTPTIIVRGMESTRFWDEIVSVPALVSLVPGLRWAAGSRVRAATNTSTAVVDVHGSSEKALPQHAKDFLEKRCGFAKIKMRRHLPGETAASIGGSVPNGAQSQQTLVLVFSVEEAGLYPRKITDRNAAKIEPVSWLSNMVSASARVRRAFALSLSIHLYAPPFRDEQASVVMGQLFPSPSRGSLPRYLAMTLVRGADLARCLRRSYDAVESETAAENSFEYLVWLMHQCFQADSDVEAVVSTIRQQFGHMEV